MSVFFARRTVAISTFLLSSIGSAVSGGEVDFASDVQPILARRCYACHGPDQQEGSLRFDDRSTLVGEADSGLIPIAPGKAAESELVRRITTKDESERMPPEGKPLSESEVAILIDWIESGANYTSHWAFQPPTQPALPSVTNRVWPQQPLDNFVLARIEGRGLEPASQATAEELVRRVYLDVIGLPPSPETVESLSRNWSHETYQRLVDRLLADPAFGERWARNWLDVVRFAETNSFERDGVKPNAWKYRDYVIHAFSSDKPYDQFIREQIAGDELDTVTDESLTATGYYRLGIWDDEPADPLQAEFDGYDDLVTTTSQAFLALTLNCARCHDHKIDPLTQKDYYGMVAFLRDVTPYGTRGDQRTNSQIDLDPELAKEYDDLAARRRAIERESRQIEQTAIKQMPAADQRATESPGRRKLLSEKLQQYVSAETWEEYSQLQGELEQIDRKKRQLPPRRTVLGLAKLTPRPKQTYVLLRGNPHSDGAAVEPAFPKLLGGGVPPVPTRPEDAHSAGRRRILADWLAANDNWLTARVIVNRIWLHYFGRGIVRSPNNFGLMGEPPTHPQMLDFLATELVRNRWHLKSIHRMILLSSTYQLSSRAAPRLLSEDPANDLFCRQNVRRLSAEQIRDSVLAVTQQLNEQQYGRSMYPALSAEVLASQSRPGSGWEQSSASDQARRSIYIHVKRSLPVPLLSAFDFPETDISCEARFLTTQPGQALSMLNSQWMQQQASALLRRVQRDVGESLPLQAQRCLEVTLARPAEPEDVAELVDLVRRLQDEHDMSQQAAREAMCLVALNLNAFFYLD